MYKRAQAAMEFLMTYGWAILVVLIAIGALAYFGVLNPARFLPQKCTFSAGVSCGDFVLTSGTLQLRLNNNLGDTVNITGISAINTENAQTCDTSDVDTSTGYIWNDGQLMSGTSGILEIDTCNLPSNPGQRYRVSVSMNYTGSSGLSHSLSGDVVGRTE